MAKQRHYCRQYFCRLTFSPGSERHILRWIRPFNQKMMRIVGIQPHSDPQQEFVLLQNQSILKDNLKGYLLLDEDAILDQGALDCRRVYAFSDEIMIPASAFVMLISGSGTSEWGRSRDGSLVYYQYWNRRSSVWFPAVGKLKLLGVVHAKQPKGSDALFVGQTA